MIRSKTLEMVDPSFDFPLTTSTLPRPIKIFDIDKKNKTLGRYKADITELKEILCSEKYANKKVGYYILG